MARARVPRPRLAAPESPPTARTDAFALTRMHDVSSLAPQRPAGPRCHCGTPIVHTPGKVPRTYCSDRCRKAAKRAIERGAAVSGGNPGHLGNTTTEFRSPSRPAVMSAGATPDAERDRPTDTLRSDAARMRRASRYAARRTLWRITSDKACRGCGRTAMDPETGVIWARTSAGVAIAMGLLKCGRIWFCPVCSAKIRHGRSEEITRAVVAWLRQGGRAYLVTFTARHTAADRLADLMNALQGTRADADAGIKRQPGAYQRLITGAAWAGDRRRAANQTGIRGRIGYLGMIRATEVTVGQGNGWHPHIHAIVLVGGRTEGERADKRIVGTFEPSASALTEWEDHWRAVWTKQLAQIDPAFRPSDRCAEPGCTCGGKGHGVDFKALATERDARDLGEYIAKTQDGKAPALELARGDLKDGLNGNMTPFQVLGRIGDLMGGVALDDAAGHGELPWLLALWSEYEAAVSGRRAMEWTRYLRPLLGLDGGDTEDDDMDVLFELDAAHDFREGVQISERAWHKLTARALDLAVVEAVEGTELRLDTLGDLVASAGESRAFLRPLTPDQVTELFGGVLTKLTERREAAAERRRREAAEGVTGTSSH